MERTIFLADDVARIRAEERERCAKVAESVRPGEYTWDSRLARAIAAAIRVENEALRKELGR